MKRTIIVAAFLVALLATGHGVALASDHHHHRSGGHGAAALLPYPYPFAPSAGSTYLYDSRPRHFYSAYPQRFSHPGTPYAAPAPLWVWAPGSWYWTSAGWAWVPGRWLLEYPGY